MSTNRILMFNSPALRDGHTSTLRRLLHGALAFCLASGAAGQTEVWRTSYPTNAIIFEALAPAPGNGVYALGALSTRAARALRIADSGAVIWEREIRYSFSVDEEVHPKGVVPTTSGGCVVAGGRFNTVTSVSDMWVRVYDSNGGLVWQQLDADLRVAHPTSVAVGSSDEVFVGAVAGIKKYSSVGAPLWSVPTPYVLGMTGDGAGGVWACGSATGPGTPPDFDAWVARYDAAGNQLFFDVFGAGLVAGATSIAPDGVGGVYITGDSSASMGGIPVSGIGCWLQRRTGAGVVSWTRTFGTVGMDYPKGVALDEFDNAIVAGYTNGASLAAPNSLNYDCWLMRFDASGALVWSASIATPVTFPAIYDVTVGTSGAVYVGGTMSLRGFISRFDNDVLPTLGASYCSPAVPNSTGAPSRLRVFGSAYAYLSEVTLLADSLPAQAFGYFLTSATQGNVANPAGSQGVLCLGGAIGRFVGPGQILNSGASSQFRLRHDLTNHPTPSGLIQVQAGETWNFQAWYRDVVGGGATSNFSDGLSLTFF